MDCFVLRINISYQNHGAENQPVRKNGDSLKNQIKKKKSNDYSTRSHKG